MAWVVCDHVTVERDVGVPLHRLPHQEEVGPIVYEWTAASMSDSWLSTRVSCQAIGSNLNLRVCVCHTIVWQHSEQRNTTHTHTHTHMHCYESHAFMLPDDRN